MHASGVGFITIVLLLSVVLQLAGAESGGLLNPPSYYQRYRRAEYPSDQPFYQVIGILKLF